MPIPSLKKPVISPQNTGFRDSTYRTYRTYKTYQFAEYPQPLQKGA